MGNSKERTSEYIYTRMYIHTHAHARARARTHTHTYPLFLEYYVLVLFIKYFEKLKAATFHAQMPLNDGAFC